MERQDIQEITGVKLPLFGWEIVDDPMDKVINSLVPQFETRREARIELINTLIDMMKVFATSPRGVDTMEAIFIAIKLLSNGEQHAKIIGLDLTVRIVRGYDNA